MKTFMNLPKFEEAKVLILPVPYEKTSSYKRGTKNGPDAILRASNELELFDVELKTEPYKVGVSTLDAVDNLEDLGKVRKDRFVIALGGEHSISFPLIKRLDQEDLSILQIDAHADLKDEFEGNKMSHACVMRRVFEINKNITQVGIRSLDKEEYDFIKKNKINCFFMHEKFDVKKIVKSLKKNVYITIDLDCFDLSVISDVGTPEPDGLKFRQVLELLEEVFKKRNVVGVDVVELIGKDDNSSYVAAKLVYKIIGYLGLYKFAM